jgi:hypothetical protein
MDKFCNKCQSTKPLIEFHKNKSSKDGLALYCKKCCNITSEKYRKPKKEKIIIDYSNQTEKHCSKCNTVKSIDKFGKRKNTKDGLQRNCVDCCEIDHKKWRDKNLTKRHESAKEWRKNNPEKNKELIKNWIKNNPEKYKQIQKNSKKRYYEKNPEKQLEKIERLKEWRKNNPERSKELRKIWERNNLEKTKELRKRSNIKYYGENKEKINEWLKTYIKDRRKNDILFKLSTNYRSRLSSFYKNSGIKKIQKTNKIIGCSWEELHIHIKSKFKDGMSNENYGDWHIDHMIPLASAKNEEELVRLCHYTNLQPLWAEENRIKKDNIM